MDSHAHLTSEEYKMDARGAILRAKAVGIERIVNICTNPKELEAGLLLEEEFVDIIKNVASTTPHDAHQESNEIFSFFEKHAQEGSLAGIGETGFDDFIEPDNISFQEDACRKYIDLAIRCDLPVVFHVRGDKAFERVFLAAKEFPKFSGIVHCFTGNSMQAEKALELGWHISISGIATFKKSSELRDVIKTIPIEKMLMETDSPWLAPQGYRGKDNEPAFVTVVANTIADCIGVSTKDVLQKTYDNGSSLFWR